MIVVDYIDELALLANTFDKAESQLQSLEEAPGIIGLYVNVDKTEFMCFKLERAICTSSGKPLKFADHFT